MLRAARALAADASDRRLGAAIRLVKRVPVASGIGGGSADAAATLKALDALWGLGRDGRALARIGLALGADVPACLTGRTARVGGIGEIVAPAPPLPRFGVVLVNPGVPVATSAVYRALAGGFSGRAPDPPANASATTFAEWLAGLRNDLAAPAVVLAPVIEEVLTVIARTAHCLLARLSGSGGTCFGLYPDEAAAEKAAAGIAVAHPGWWVTSTRFIDEPPRPRPT